MYSSRRTHTFSRRYANVSFALSFYRFIVFVFFFFIIYAKSVFPSKSVIARRPVSVVIVKLLLTPPPPLPPSVGGEFGPNFRVRHKPEVRKVPRTKIVE